MTRQFLRRGLDAVAAGDIRAAAALLDGGDLDAIECAQLAGALATARGGAERARLHFSAVLAVDPDNAAAHCGMGVALQSLGRPAEAAASFCRASELVPDDADALIGQGECCLALGHLEEARDCFEIALAHAPGSARALCGLGRLLRLAGDAGGSIRVLREALAAGENADILFELGLSLNLGADVEGARCAYERALVADPVHLGALVNLGLVHLAQRGEPGPAAVLFERACAAHPDSVAAQANYGLALQEQGDIDRALTHFDRLAQAHPQVVEYRWNRGIARLYRGDFVRGWEDYELRHSRGGRDVSRDFGLAPWTGDDPGRHRLLVYGEQGLGDEIMFASCLPEIAARAGGIVLECDARLAVLFARSFPALTVHGAARDGSREWLQRFPALDRQVAIGSLPRLLRRSAGTFPAHAGYLAPDPVRVAGWRRRLEEAGGLAVGLSWRGGTRKTRADLRSLALADCAVWAATRPCTFVCLQRGDCGAEVAQARAGGLALQWWPEALEDPDESAALIAALDLVISVDNTVVHLAGALGKPCWTLLPHVPDWRYGLRGETMPWYPSLRLFRQPRSRDWPAVVAAVARALAALPER